MRHLAKLALALSLLAPTLADAKPRKATALTAPTRDSAWHRACVHERTGPVGGVSVAEARAICTAEEPSKLDQRIARDARRADKAAARAAKVQERCELALYDACMLRTDDTAACAAADYSVCSTRSN